MASKITPQRFIDIGANLTDAMFQGKYHGKKVHQPDLDLVMKRSFESGLDKIIITGGNIKDSREALQLASTNDALYCTVGCHPTRCGEFENTKGVSPEGYMKSLLQLVENNRSKVIAIGEFGLDYDRLFFCKKETQLKYFEKQLELVEATGLPMFLHCRSAFDDFFDIMSRNRSKYKGGVVHSFTGTPDEALKVVDMGFCIGLNGCSLKTDDNLKAVEVIPADKILLETDCPWCEIKQSHASYKHVKTHFDSKKKEKWDPGFSVKSRCEPRNIVQVLEAVAAVKKMDEDLLAQQIFSNTCNLFRSLS